MKIAMADPSLFTGRYDDSLCDALARSGHDVTLLGRPMRSTDAIEPSRYRYDPRFFPVSERLRGVLGEGMAFRATKAGEYIATARWGDLSALAAVDILHCQWLPFPAADGVILDRIARARNRAALVHTVHNASAFHGDGGMQGRGYRALLDRFDALIVHGDATRESLLAQGIGDDRIHVVPHPPMALASAVADDLAAVPDPVLPRILFFGTIRPYKGVDVLIDACRALWRDGASFELAIAGKPFFDVGPVLETVRADGFGDRMIADLGFHTEARLDAHLCKADVLVFPYRDIDSSGAFLSALDYGKAMVATRVGMFAGLDEGAVSLVPPDDAPALAQAIAPLIADAELRAACGAAAKRLHAAMGGWMDAAAATLDVYASARERM